MPDLLTLDRAAKLAGYADPSPLRHAIRRGSLRAHYEVVNGRAVHVVDRDDLRQYLDRRVTHRDERNVD